MRRHPKLRDLVRETRLSPDDLLLPLFVKTGGGREPVASMPGVFQLPLSALKSELDEVASLGLPGVKTVRSSSMFGFSSIYVIFEDGVEFYWSRTRVLEKLNSLPSGTLPEGVQPALGPDATPLGQIYWYTLEGRDPDGKPVGGWV